MPEFETYVDVDVDDFVLSCKKREIKELVEFLVQQGHISSSAIPSHESQGVLESFFMEKMDKLKEKYYRLSQEDEQILEDLFKKYV